MNGQNQTPQSEEKSELDLMEKAETALTQANTGITQLPMLLLITPIIDDSSSIVDYQNDGPIRRGYQAMLEKWRQSAGNVLVRAVGLNRGEIHPYLKPIHAPTLDTENYRPAGGTPLFLRVQRTLEEIATKVAELEKQFFVCSMTLVFTDGNDNESQGILAEHNKTLVDPMLASGRHIVAGVGVRDGHTDFHAVFLSMGIPEKWIRVLERDANDIEESMRDFGDVSTHASRDYDTFTETSIGGFDHLNPPRPPTQKGGSDPTS